MTPLRQALKNLIAAAQQLEDAHGHLDWLYQQGLDKTPHGIKVRVPELQQRINDKSGELGDAIADMLNESLKEAGRELVFPFRTRPRQDA